MPDLLVIGGGFTGAAAAVAARARGLDVVVLRSRAHPSASEASAGLFREEWYDRSKVKPAIEWLGLTPSREIVRLGWGANKGVEHDRLIQMCSPELVLRRAGAVTCEVQRIDRLRSHVTVHGRTLRTSAPALLIAAGVHTDSVLRMAGAREMGVTGLYGRALLVARDVRDSEHVLTLRTGPYQHFTSRPLNEFLRRIGDTVERRPGQHHLDNLRRRAHELHPGGLDTRVTVEGHRPVLPGGPYAGLVAPRIAVATGGARIGLGLAMPLALEALDSLEAWL